MNLTTGQQKIALDMIVESPTNPRKTFHKLDELAESMKKAGQLQAILVRPVGSNGSTRAEIVFGHRRYRAAKLAGLEELTCDVRPMSDVEVLEAQLIENLQREEVDPLEEADGFRRLIDDHGYTADDLAAKIGKSKALVYGRLKLCALGDEGRKALADGVLTPSTALLVARVPAPLQADAVDELDPGDDDEGRLREPLGAREALRRIQAKFMLRLSTAAWDLADSDLVPSAGPCTTCPKRTGNQPELFADVRAVDSCTDPTCFASKRDATWERQKADAVKAGREVLDAKKGAALFPYGRLVQNSGFVDLDEKDFGSSGGKKTFRDRFGKKLDPASIVLARDNEGVVHELVDAKVMKALEPARPGAAAALERDDAPPARAKDRAEDKEEQEKRAAERAAIGTIIAAVVAKAQKADFDRSSLAALIEYVRPMSALERVLERRGFLAAAKDDRDKAERAFDFAVAKMAAADLRGVLVELLVTDRVMDLSREAPFGAFCVALNVDVKGAVAKERARIKAEAKAADTAAATPKAKAKAAKKPAAKAPAKKATKSKKK